jgi:Tetratricopeptide repeat
LRSRSFRVSRLRRLCALALPAVILSSISGTAFAATKATPGTTAAATTANSYVGSAICARCHAAVSRQYAKTAMGRSMVRVSGDTIPDLTVPGHFANEHLNREFDVFKQAGQLFESESSSAPDGTEIFRDAHRIEYLIGAGINGYGPVIQRDGYLFQAPLSFYTKPKAWAPSPGYEALDLGFSRPILPGCLFCHSGRANPVPNTNGQYENQPFSEMSIGCENCHGPGAEHVAAMTKPAASAGGATYIVNPSRLSPYLADNLCMACHQTGDARVLKPGKSFNDIAPEQPLDDTLSILMVPPTRENPPDVDHVEHYYSMILSKCFRASGGRLSCITCHDPHVQPTSEEAPAYYAKKCLTCHTNQSCKLPIAARMREQPSNNCIGCHMPKRDIQVISHSSATNHRIVATQDEPFPDVTFEQTTAALPDLIHLDPAPGKEQAALPQLTLLQAYGELAATRPEYAGPYLKVLAELEKTQPDNSLVQAAAGRRELKAGNYADAVDHLQQAVKLGPPRATTFADLAEALAKQGKKDEALAALDQSIALDPFNPLTQRTLVARLIELKQYERARSALEKYVRTFPQDAFMREMLAKAPPRNSQ